MAKQIAYKKSNYKHRKEEMLEELACPIPTSYPSNMGQFCQPYLYFQVVI